VISPLFFALIGGIPLAFVYRAVNTMDSMLGYRNEKYIDFGKVAARLDDIANYIPARLTGLFIVVAAGILGFDAKGSLQSIVSDAAKHPSPNSGIAEAGVAGALGIQLGGLNYYGGIASRRAYMGKPLQMLQPAHIQQTISIMQVVVLVFLATATILFAIL
jgi:adenosylcobinamide-phosphate synthase